MKRRTLLSAVGAGAAVLGAPMLRAQTLPSGPIRVIVGFPPGGGTDALARVMAVKLQALWNTTVVIENKAGAAGVIAADYVAKQVADGNTLLMAHINSHAIAPSLQPKLGYQIERDFTPIALVGVTPNLLICNPQQPAKTVQELVALCKQQPGKISFASAGGGSAQHLALEMFKLRAGIDALHVPYKGSVPALTDVNSGQVAYCIERAGSTLPFVRNGRLKAYGVSLEKGSSVTPGIPPLATAAGIPGFDLGAWFGMMAPANTPRPIVEQLTSVLEKAMQTPEMKKAFDGIAIEIDFRKNEDFTRYLKMVSSVFSDVIRRGNIKP